MSNPKSKKPTLKRSMTSYTQPQEQSLEKSKKQRQSLEQSASYSKPSEESMTEENSTQELSQEEQTYNNLMKDAYKSVKLALPLAFQALKKEFKTLKPKREEKTESTIESWGICKKKGSNLGRIFSVMKTYPGFNDVPKSFKWRDEVSIMDLVPFEGATREGRTFREMRTPSGKPIVGLREYIDL